MTTCGGRPAGGRLHGRLAANGGAVSGAGGVTAERHIRYRTLAPAWPISTPPAGTHLNQPCPIHPLPTSPFL